MKTEPTMEQVAKRLPAHASSFYVSNQFTYGQIRVGEIILWWPRGDKHFELEMCMCRSPSRVGRQQLKQVIEAAETRLQDAKKEIDQAIADLCTLRAAAFPTTQDEDDAC